jgi:hypothetical protein
VSWVSEDKLALSASVMDASVGVVGVSADFEQPPNPETSTANSEYASQRFKIFIRIPPLLSSFNYPIHSQCAASIPRWIYLRRVDEEMFA